MHTKNYDYVLLYSHQRALRTYCDRKVIYYIAEWIELNRISDHDDDFFH